ncbi:hypothetical protein AGLY_007553 [Aphis glycines]|uniref:Uncharacterized protein n=1 Tax=Aphis glycines TaxID=307491 RepID=A0A6G0TMC7_APHGL|nr:hypothetical protein AGLY_007553 [Aphis glycines]
MITNQLIENNNNKFIFSSLEIPTLICLDIITIKFIKKKIKMTSFFLTNKHNHNVYFIAYNSSLLLIRIRMIRNSTRSISGQMSPVMIQSNNNTFSCACKDGMVVLGLNYNYSLWLVLGRYCRSPPVPRRKRLASLLGPLNYRNGPFFKVKWLTIPTARPEASGCAVRPSISLACTIAGRILKI